jgi:hypothetical protein
MRGSEGGSEGLFSYIRLEERIAVDHPLRAIRALTNEVLAALSRRFEALYSHLGRPSIPPEYLLRATALQAQTYRGNLRLDQGGGRCCPGESPRPRKGQSRL